MVNLEDKKYKDKTKQQKQDYMDTLIKKADIALDTWITRKELLDSYKANLLDKKPK